MRTRLPSGKPRGYSQAKNVARHSMPRQQSRKSSHKAMDTAYFWIVLFVALAILLASH